MPLRPQGYDPHEKHTSPWDLLVTAAHLARRVVWLLISYVRVSLLFVWYCLMVLAWEQHCWSESCVACPSTNPDPTPTPNPTPNRTPNPNPTPTFTPNLNPNPSPSPNPNQVRGLPVERGREPLH